MSAYDQLSIFAWLLADVYVSVGSFPKELITDETIELLQPYLVGCPSGFRKLVSHGTDLQIVCQDHKDFNPTKTKLGSPVASALCIWVSAKPA